MFLLNLMITFCVHMIIPCIVLKEQGKLPKKKATKIALINSIVCLVFFCILRACISGGNNIIGNSFAPATLYFFIVKAMLTEKNVTQNNAATKNVGNNKNSSEKKINQHENQFNKVGAIVEHKNQIENIKNDDKDQKTNQ